MWYFVLDSFYNYVFGGPYVGALAKATMGSTFWLTTILTVFILMVPVLAWRFYSFDCHPSLADKIRMKQREFKQSRTRPEILRTPSARRSRRSLRSSYAFAHEVSFDKLIYVFMFSQHLLQEGFGRLITSGKIMRKLPQDFAFPLGIGTKKQQSLEHPTNGVLKANNKILPGGSNNGFNSKAPLSDLDTINL
jgi:phospholipid-translocating ATPase